MTTKLRSLLEGKGADQDDNFDLEDVHWQADQPAEQEEIKRAALHHLGLLNVELQEAPLAISQAELSKWQLCEPLIRRTLIEL